MTQSNAKPADRVSTDCWFSPIRFSLLLGLFVAVRYRELLAGGQSMFFRDFGHFGFPLAYHLRESIWSAEIPLWNPLSNCGLPFLAQWNSMALYPLSLVYCVLPLTWALNLFCLFHLFFGGLGMYGLIRNRTANQFAAAVAGMAFSFSGLMSNCLMWPNNIAAFGVMPWVIWSATGTVRLGGKRFLTASIIGAIQMLSGGVEIILSTWVLTLVFVCADRLCPGSSRVQYWWRVAGLAAMITGLCAIQLLPFFDLLRQSQRSGDPDVSSPMPLSGWANLLVPLFQMAQSPTGLFYQPGQVWVTSYYLGVGVVAIAVVGLLWRPVRMSIVLALFAVLCLVLALGDEGMIYRLMRTAIPYLGLMRFPVKFIIPVAFIIPWLAGLALARLCQVSSDQRSAWLKRACLAISALFLLIALICWWADQHPVQGIRSNVVLANAAARSAILAALLLALFGLRRRPGGFQQFLRTGVVIVLWLDVVTHAPNQVPTVDARLLAADLSDIREMNPVPQWGSGRAMLSRAALTVFDRTILADATNSYVGIRLGLYCNCNLLERIPKFDGFYSLNLRKMDTIERHVYTDLEVPWPLVDFLGVTQITSRRNTTEWTNRTTAMPLITAGQTPVPADEASSLRGILSADFQPRSQVYLPPESPTVSPRRPTDAKVVRQKADSHRVEAVVRASEASVVSIAQTWHSAWKAYVDGTPTRLWQANYAFQAVILPPGEHTITLVYRDYWFLSGTLISWMAFIITSLKYLRSRSNTLAETILRARGSAGGN